MWQTPYADAASRPLIPLRAPGDEDNVTSNSRRCWLRTAHHTGNPIGQPRVWHWLLTTSAAYKFWAIFHPKYLKVNVSFLKKRKQQQKIMKPQHALFLKRILCDVQHSNNYRQSRVFPEFTPVKPRLVLSHRHWTVGHWAQQYEPHNSQTVYPKPSTGEVGAQHEATFACNQQRALRLMVANYRKCSPSLCSFQQTKPCIRRKAIKAN